MVGGKEVKPNIDKSVSFFMREVMGVFNCVDGFRDDVVW
jgi:hypothetical protein